MNERSPDLINYFEAPKGRVTAYWFDIDMENPIPDLPWQQVYAVCNLDGKTPVVLYEDDHVNLPGGGTEEGESVEQTLARELIEELNCKLVSWKPIGYQANFVDDELDCYQLRVYAEIEKLGEFVSDIGGEVIGYKLIDLENLAEEIKWGNVGDRIQAIASRLRISSAG